MSQEDKDEMMGKMAEAIATMLTYHDTSFFGDKYESEVFDLNSLAPNKRARKLLAEYEAKFGGKGNEH